LQSADLAIGTRGSAARKGIAFRAIRFLSRITEYRRELGSTTGLRWYLAQVLVRLPLPGVQSVKMRPPGLAYPVTVRMFPSSDGFVFDQIFVRHEYTPVCDRIADPKLILDLGANAGYASAFFASRFPSAKILALEPDPGNYQLSLRNAEAYGGRVSVMQGAVWGNTARLALTRENSCDGRDWSTRVVEPVPGTSAEVQAWDMNTLLYLAGGEGAMADLVKIDIEGSEAEVFAANPAQWLGRVRNICVELHDDKCREIFRRALAGFRYEMVESGEFTCCFNISRI
jgi:FkbM family methyltransferase